MRSAVVLLAVAACVPPDEAELAATPPPAGPLALYRIDHGDCLSSIASKLGYRGGWKALADANGLRGDWIRAGRGLVVALDRLPAGVDAYGDLGLLPFDPPLPAQPLVACASEHADGPCATLAGITACVEATAPVPDDDDPDELGRELAIYRGGERRAFPLPSHGPLWLDAHAADLDGDRRPELVIAVPLDRRNRLSFAASRVFVVDGELVTQLDVEQWGRGSLLAAGDRCDLLATKWDDFTDPLEGLALYFIGRRLAYRDGALVPAGELVARRMRTFFHVAGFSDADFERPLMPAAPAEWLANRASWWREPPPEFAYRNTLHADEASGTITSVEASREGVALAITRDNGEPIVLDPRVNAFDEQRGALSLGAIVWAPTGGVLPEHYVPAESSRWVGARVVVDRYSDDEARACDATWGCPFRAYVARLSPR